MAIEAGGCKAEETLLPNIIFDLSKKKIHNLSIPKDPKSKIFNYFLRNSSLLDIDNFIGFIPSFMS